MERNGNGLNGQSKRKRLSSTSSDPAPSDVNEESKQHKVARPNKDSPTYLQDLHRYLEDKYSSDEPDQCRWITRDLESGSHVLVFEHNYSIQTKCRAYECLVQGLKKPRQLDEKIRSPYRINLQAKQPDVRHWSQLDRPNRQFFHVSCLESIGVDMAQHITLPPEHVVGDLRMGAGYSLTSQQFHPAIFDWVTQKGKAFDAALYHEYDKTLKKYEKDFSNAIMIHKFSCSGNCRCGLPLERPKSSDFIEGEPTERTLSDVLLHIMDADHLDDAPTELRIALLEVWGEVPPSFTKTALASTEDEEDTEDESEEHEQLSEEEQQEDDAAGRAEKDQDATEGQEP